MYSAVRRVSADCPITLVEQSPDCCRELYLMTGSDRAARLVQADFLTCDRSRIGEFDSVIMNPPFKIGRDITHIKHALTLLSPGGVLVSLCAGGPRQRRDLEPMVDEWIGLPPGSFREAGTMVNAAIVVIRK